MNSVQIKMMRQWLAPRRLKQILLGGFLVVLVVVGIRAVAWKTGWLDSVGRGTCWSIRHIEANNNDYATVRMEMEDPTFLVAMAKAAGVGAWRMRGKTLKLEGDDYLYTWLVNENIPKRVADLLDQYVLWRIEGHSAEYCREMLFVSVVPGATRYQIRHGYKNSQLFMYSDSRLSQQSVEPNAKGGTTNNLVVLDGELAWSIVFDRLPDGGIDDHPSDGSMDGFHATVLDGGEFDPVKSVVVKEVDALVEQQMRTEGVFDKFGSCHTFWARKKDMLRARGIRWQSPAELNPHTNYD